MVGAGPSDEEIRTAVRQAGFTPGEIRRVKAQAAGSGKAAKGGKRAELGVEGMRCEYCVANIAGTLERREGVISADVDLTAQRAVVEYDPEKITAEEIAETIEGAGEFKAKLKGEPHM